MAGCCHGRVCDLPIGITFSDPETHAEPMDMPLYPTQLFDIGVNLIILITVFLIERKKKFDGQLFLIYLVMYAIGRSIVEMYRGDEARGYVFNGLLSHSQFIAILVFLATVWVWRRWSASDQEL
jgi:phosphatidylglycerol:prolipoprotein diacylglycerol transferase